jgi:SH3 domain-containing YSC84-like protein 1
VSIAAGPVGRNAEAAGAASLKSVAGIFSYSRTKGLFAGVSLEGSAIVERRDANEKLYGQRLTAAQLLTGAVRPPPQAAPLLNVLSTRIFNGTRQGNTVDDNMYNDVPVYDDRHDDVVWNGQRGSAYGEGQTNSPQRSNTWQDDAYDRPAGGAGFSRSNTIGSRGGAVDDDYVYRDRPSESTSSAGPTRPAAPKPNFASKQALMKKNEAVALYTFEAAQEGDLGFKKGEIITVLKKTDSDNDWW